MIYVPEVQNLQHYRQLFDDYGKKYRLTGVWSDYMNAIDLRPREIFQDLLDSEPRVICFNMPQYGLTEEQKNINISWEDPVLAIEDITKAIQSVEISLLNDEAKGKMIENILDDGIVVLLKNQALLKLIEQKKQGKTIGLYRAGEKETNYRLGSHLLESKVAPDGMSLLDLYRGYPVSWWFVKSNNTNTKDNTFLKKGRMTYSSDLDSLLENGFILPDENTDGIVYIDLQNSSIDPVLA